MFFPRTARLSLQCISHSTSSLQRRTSTSISSVKGSHLKTEVDKQISRKEWASIPFSKLAKYDGTETPVSFRKKIEAYFLNQHTRIREDGTRSFSLLFTVLIKPEDTQVYLENRSNLKNLSRVFENEYFQFTLKERMDLLADMTPDDGVIRALRFKQIFVKYPRPISVPWHYDDFPKHCTYELSGDSNSKLQIGQLKWAYTNSFIVNPYDVVKKDVVPPNHLTIFTKESPHKVDIKSAPRIVSILGLDIPEDVSPCFTYDSFRKEALYKISIQNPFYFKF